MNEKDSRTYRHVVLCKDCARAKLCAQEIEQNGKHYHIYFCSGGEKKNEPDDYIRRLQKLP